MEEVKKNKNSFYLAGIVPVAGQTLDFNLPWHDCLMPLSQNYLAIERAVVECAYAGCETIWIVCNDDTQPLIRHRLGDYIQDPVWLGRKLSSTPTAERKEIPIFYVPIHPNDRDKRDCLGWSILHGALTAYYISKNMSKWMTPDRYYAAFPYGVYPVEFLRQYRKNISSDQGFVLSCYGKTIKNGEYLGFTFDSKDFVRFRKNLREQATGKYITEEKEQIPKKTLPIHERYSARYFSLDKVFSSVILGGVFTVEPIWYHNVDSWEGYCGYLSSEDRKSVKRPSKLMFSYKELNLIGENIE